MGLLDQRILGGKAVIKGTRIPVYLILELLGSGLTRLEIISQYPSLNEDDINSALIYASESLKRKP